MTKKKLSNEELLQAMQDNQQENQEIRRYISDLRRRGEKVNYAEIGRKFNKSRQRIEQIDKGK